MLVVTHSPQVAARARPSLAGREERRGKGASLHPRRARSTPRGRREEIARMLSGATVTDEARAAADRLMAAAAGA